VDCGRCHAKQADAFRQSVHGPSKAGGASAAACTDCHGSHEVLSSKDRASPIHPSRLADTCGSCHAKGKSAPGRANAKQLSFEAYTQSVHYRALTKGGLLVAATCVSCHGSHDMRSAADEASSVNRWNVPNTCAECHRGIFTEYSEGVHGQALARRSADTPVCTDCHGEHGIRARTDPKSRVYATTISKSTCPQCHSAARINDKYGLAAGQAETYRESFHGLADQFGETKVANCASCHGAHRILNSSDPKSTINPANLPVTCGKCHPGATANFAKGGIHRSIVKQEAAVKRIVRSFYFVMIVTTIGLMLLHNLLDYFAAMREYYRSTRDKRRHVRFLVTERRQHLLLVLSFATLVFTGFALQYPDAFWVKPIIDSELSFLVRGHAHRVAAVVFVALSVYHFGYLLGTRRGRDQWRNMMPRMQDLRDLGHQLSYYVGARKHRGHFGRYSYVEKSEYFALIWGSVVMIITGLILWFEEGALTWLPKWGWDLAELVHLYEAWLATLAILAWHLYHVAFKPGGHRATFAMLTGELTEEEMRHEHPAELEALRAREAAPVKEAGH
jgi:formate dehydrogenase gamma subunit